MSRRFLVLGVGLAVGAVIALGIAGPLMPEGLGFRDRAIVWAAVMGGPVLGIAWDMTFAPIRLGLLGGLLIPAHPVWPHWATALLTAVGLILWFFAGFITVMAAVWGG